MDSPSKIKQLELDLSRAKSAVDVWAHGYEDLQTSHDKLDKENSDKSAIIRDLRDKLCAANQFREALEENCQFLEKKVLDLEKQLENLTIEKQEDSGSSDEFWHQRSDSLENELNDLQRKFDDLKDSLAKQQKDHDVKVEEVIYLTREVKQQKQLIKNAADEVRKFKQVAEDSEDFMKCTEKRTEKELCRKDEQISEQFNLLNSSQERENQLNDKAKMQAVTKISILDKKLNDQMDVISAAETQNTVLLQGNKQLERELFLVQREVDKISGARDILVKDINLLQSESSSIQEHLRLAKEQMNLLADAQEVQSLEHARLQSEKESAQERLREFADLRAQSEAVAAEMTRRFEASQREILEFRERFSNQDRDIVDVNMSRAEALLERNKAISAWKEKDMEVNALQRELAMARPHHHKNLDAVVLVSNGIGNGDSKSISSGSGNLSLDLLESSRINSPSLRSRSSHVSILPKLLIESLDEADSPMESSSLIMNRADPSRKTLGSRPRAFRHNGDDLSERKEELARRNQKQPPHLQSSYPVEAQAHPWRISTSSSSKSSGCSPCGRKKKSATKIATHSVFRLFKKSHNTDSVEQLTMQSYSSTASPKLTEMAPPKSSNVLTRVKQSMAFTVENTPKKQKTMKTKI